MRFLKLAFVCLLFVSCDKHEDSGNSDYGVFSFDSEGSVVYVDSSTRSFDLKCHYIEMPSKELYGKWPLVDFDAERSTAVPGVHFVYTPIRKFSGSGGAELTYTLELIPENITEDVDLIFTTRPTMQGIVYDEKTGSVSYFSGLHIDPETGEEYEYDYLPIYDGFIGETVILLRPLK
ncbi:MAG: hypothetical protein KH375_04255 [Alistipes sp.]|nr:hypothetical protein [Alistipes sp.]